MRAYYILTFLIFSFICALGQKKQLTLSEIWASRTFVPAGIEEGKSMNDGTSFSLLGSTGAGDYIARYSYKTGQL
jgi:hypothetical protein